MDRRVRALGALIALLLAGVSCATPPHYVCVGAMTADGVRVILCEPLPLGIEMRP